MTLKTTAYKTRVVPVEELAGAVEQYKRHQALAGKGLSSLTKRRASRALTRLAKACREVMRAIDALPEETSYLAALRTVAADIHREANWRLQSVQANRARALDPRVMLEDEIGRLYQRHGGRLTTYDPRRYVEPRGGEGSRGGRLAQLLLKAYSMAGIKPPADLTPTLRRLKDAAEGRGSGRGHATNLSGAFPRSDGTEVSYPVDGGQPLLRPLKRVRTRGR